MHPSPINASLECPFLVTVSDDTSTGTSKFNHTIPDTEDEGDDVFDDDDDDNDHDDDDNAANPRMAHK